MHYSYSGNKCDQKHVCLRPTFIRILVAYIRSVAFNMTVPYHTPNIATISFMLGMLNSQYTYELTVPRMVLLGRTMT
jgi:hypothetical protein